VKARPLSRSEIAALAEDLRKMLDRIEAGELVASTSTRLRLEGAVAALAVIQGRSAGLSFDLPQDEDRG
jgi:hypothetical protein